MYIVHVQGPRVEGENGNAGGCSSHSQSYSAGPQSQTSITPPSRAREVSDSLSQSSSQSFYDHSRRDRQEAMDNEIFRFFEEHKDDNDAMNGK